MTDEIVPNGAMTSLPDTPKETAAPANGPTGATCIIVHPNVLVAEDLREILLSSGAHDVRVHRNLAEVGAAPVALVIVSDSLQGGLHTSHLDAWVQKGTQVILLGSNGPAGDPTSHGLHSLNEPFRTEDVVALVTKLGVF